jgi:glycosyltransferase involved in cell wall biosynthesis
MISALIINYNYARFLAEAVDSVFGQTVTDYEVVVADDGSTDDSKEIVTEYGARVRFVGGAHVGLPENLARGVNACRGERIAFLSADDRWLPYHLETSLAALRAHPEAALAYSYMAPIDVAGNRFSVPRTLKRAVARSGWVDPLDVLPHNFVYTQTVLLRRDALDAIGGIDPTLGFTEVDLFARLVARYPIVHTGRTTVEYRVHPTSLNHNYEFTLQSRLALYEKHLGSQRTRTKQRLVARAYLKTAYRELADEPSAATARAARRHLWKGLATYPAAARPLELLLVPALLSTRLFVLVNRRFRTRLRRSRAKLLLQRLLR